jgi:AcrR family transcriptional regulator
MQIPKAEVREGILDAALSLLAEKGYRGATIPGIAELAGVSVGNVYRYFDSKDAILAQAIPEAKLAEIRDIVLGGLRALAARSSPYRAAPRGRAEAGAVARGAAGAGASMEGLFAFGRELAFLFRGARGSALEGFAESLAADLAAAFDAWAASIGARVPARRKTLVRALYVSFLALAAEAFMAAWKAGGQGRPTDPGDFLLVIEYHRSGMAALAEAWRGREGE